MLNIILVFLSLLHPHSENVDIFLLVSIDESNHTNVSSSHSNNSFIPKKHERKTSHFDINWNQKKFIKISSISLDEYLINPGIPFQCNIYILSLILLGSKMEKML